MKSEIAIAIYNANVFIPFSTTFTQKIFKQVGNPYVKQSTGFTRNQTLETSLSDQKDTLTNPNNLTMPPCTNPEPKPKQDEF